MCSDVWQDPFGVYELDRDAMELRKHGALIRLQEQPFRVLAMLAERPGEVITREQLQEQIWGNTFVDFDQSLNKAVNRVREALNDNAGTPQYVETVPRRGYRFIAPVAAPQTEAPAPAATVNTVSVPAQPRSDKSPSRTIVLAALTMAVVLAAIGIAATAWLRQPRKPTMQEARLIKSFGWEPTLSGDGKLLAYSSSVGSGEQPSGCNRPRGAKPFKRPRVPAQKERLIFRPMAPASPSTRKEKEAESTSPPLYLANLDLSSAPAMPRRRSSHLAATTSFIGKT